MKNSFKKTAGFLVASAVFVAISPSAQAQNIEQCVRQTAKCAGSTVEAQLAVLSGAANAIAFTTAHPHCVADIVTGNYVTIGISGAMVLLNIKDPYGSAARPLVEQLNKGLPFLPIGGLLTQYGDDALGAAFQSAAQLIPIPSPNPLTATLDGQLGCGSAIAVQGAQLISDVKKVAGSVKKLGQSCGAAASCFAGVLQDIITDPAGAVASAVDWAGDKIDDGLDAINPYACKNQSAASYMATHILPRVNPIAHATVWGNLDYGTESTKLYNQCYSSYEGCDSESTDAHRRCRAIIHGDGDAQAEAYNKDKGLSQRVGRRQMELGIPKQLALEHASVMAQSYSQRDTAIQKRQLDDLLPEVRERLGVQLVALGAAQRSIELKKFLGIEKIAADGKFGADQAVVLEGGVGKVLLAQADAETPKNGESWSFRFGKMYKQYVPEREVLLKAIDQQLEQRLIAQKKASFDANGEKWNVQIMLERQQKMHKEAQDHECKYFDECKDKVKLTLINYGNMVLAAGRKSQFAGLGALGVEHSDYKNYLIIRSFLEASLAQHLTSAKLAFDSLSIEKKLALTGQAPLVGAGGSRSPGVIAAAVPVGTPAASIAAASPGQQFGGVMAAPPKSGTVNAGPVGMPAAPTMGSAAMSPARAPVGGVLLSNPGLAVAVAEATIGAGGKPIGQTAAVLTEKDKPPAPVVAAIPPAQLVGGISAIPPKTSSPIGMPSAPTMGSAAMSPARAPATGLPVVTPPATPPVVVAINQAAAIGNKPADTKSQPPTPTSVTNLLPFDAIAYRKVREKEIEAEWLPKCANNSTCKTKINSIADKLLDAEAAGLKSGKPDHTNKPAVTAFLNSLAPIYEPQFKEAIALVATQLAAAQAQQLKDAEAAAAKAKEQAQKDKDAALKAQQAANMLKAAQEAAAREAEQKKIRDAQNAALKEAELKGIKNQTNRPTIPGARF